MKIFALLLSLLVTLAGCPAWAEAEYTPVPESVRELDLRIAALEARRAQISTTGPKTATLLGVGSMVVGGIALGVGMSCPYPCDDEYYARSPAAAAAGGVLLGIGFISAIAGGVVWSKRIERRNAIDAERDLLIEEREGLAATLSHLELRSPYRNGTQFVTLGVRF